MVPETKVQRKKLKPQDKQDAPIAESLMELRNEVPDLCNVVEYVIRVNGVYEDVFLYICSNPYKRREVNHKLMQLLGTDATVEWYQLIHKAIDGYGIEPSSLPYCVEYIHQAFLVGFTAEKAEKLLAVSKNSVELSRNFKEALAGDGRLDGRKESLESQGIFLKKRMPDYEGYVRMPVRVFYLESAANDPLALREGIDIWDTLDRLFRGIRRSFSAYQHRIDTLNRIVVSKDDEIKKLSQNKEKMDG